MAVANVRARNEARRSARCKGENGTEGAAVTIPLEALSSSWRPLMDLGAAYKFR